MAGRNAGKRAPAAKKTAADDKKYLCPYCLKEKKNAAAVPHAIQSAPVKQ